MESVIAKRTPARDLLSVESKERVESEEKELESKEKQVGMHIGRIAYRLYFKARPYCDSEDEVALNVQNGCYIGDINHSVAFAKNFLPYVCLRNLSILSIWNILLLKHNGKSVAASILDCISQWNISKHQFIAGSFDGQYFNLSVPEYLNQHFAEEKDKTFFYDWDPMHKASLVDDHMRKKF
ncbi:hypothetical protein JTE90_024730 [Oedothorax gibbosus]|uniref:Uncharacterized protein n=1 Tax=Oedothorax gibbosus TaxID=931172 RepID=A0AAV6U9G7_9ARAC|nr:hypothetical protein JTE90_024730 [Oedothorax gibbosus]